MTKKLRAVIFDMDGLILDTERISREGWRFAFKQFGIQLTDEFYQQFLGLTAHDVRILIAERFEGQVDFDQAFRLRQDYLSRYYEETGVPLKTGIVELLDYLQVNGIQCVVATSSTGEVATYRLTRAGIADRFEFISSSDQVRSGKPAPDVYLAAVQKLGLCADECMALEDSEAGIRAANAARVPVIWVPDLTPASKPLCDQVYAVATDLVEVRDLLAGNLEERLQIVNP